MQLDLGPSLAALKAAAILQIDTEAEAARLRYLTAGAGQALEYQATEAEARALLAEAAGGGTPDPAAYPFVQAEVAAVLSATGAAVPIADAAAAVLVEADAWKAVGAYIKELRRAAKLRVDAAPSPAAVAAAAAGIGWPAP